MNITTGCLVQIGRSGNPEQDLMYAGFLAQVKDMYVDGQAFVNLDAYTRLTGNVQAVSGSTLWPVSRLKRI